MIFQNWLQSIKIPPPPDNIEPISNYDYGDGSLNTVSMGYNGKLYLNGSIEHIPLSEFPNSSASTTLNKGNYPTYSNGTWTDAQLVTKFDSLINKLNATDSIWHVTPVNSTHINAIILQGTNTYTLVEPISGERTVYATIYGTAYTSRSQFTDFKLVFSSGSYTLKEAVSNKLIYPIVLMNSYAASTSYIAADILNVYTGGLVGNGVTYSSAHIWFMTTGKSNITAISINAPSGYASTTSYNDGLGVRSYPIEKARLTLNKYDGGYTIT